MLIGKSLSSMFLNCKLYKDIREGDVSAKLPLYSSFIQNHREMVENFEISKPD